MVKHGLQLGDSTHIAHPIYLDRLHPWLITIGDHCNLAPYVALVTHDQTLNQYTGQTRLGCVTIGSRVNIGVGAILLPGTTIGEDSVVAAGAVVHGDVPAGSLVAGNPAQVSSIRAVAAWHQVSATRAPSWPREGWTLDTGITEERKREQREALADGKSGYVPAAAAPASPYARKQAAKASRPARKAGGEAPKPGGEAPKTEAQATTADGSADQQTDREERASSEAASDNPSRA
jgi:maltose O-acetyltransferase